ncbi:hypothetical protein BDU57DRAFT_514759 [Ampelomyces quisqualis]|uniref:Peptidase A1 domain-containing protein n=1 Tax=Ampelomyces quisqualis TaxID=50730 RepID=A0A6A5QWB4_AMPQU|nr:hypothetical protein BDU57DRAFT_514759 [Ampelomyces quisqualis]
MIWILLLACVVRASVYAQAQQTPLLREHAHRGGDVVVPLTLDQDLHYTFPLSSEADGTGIISLQDLVTHRLPIMAGMSSIVIDLPLDAEVAGSISFSVNASDYSSGAIWLPYASYIEIDHVGIRKSAMISMPASSTQLSLDTAFITLPDEVFDVLLQAAHTSEKDEFVVDCAVIAILPDLVFGLVVPDEDDDEYLNPEELVVSPKQYVWEIEKGKCVLLARGAEGGRIRMGWAAIRGRRFVVDLDHMSMALLRN